MNKLGENMDSVGNQGGTVAVGAHQELARLEQLLVELGKVSEELEHRLEFVMKEPEPEKGNSTLEKLSTRSSLVVRLKERGDEVERVMYRLSSILRRLEI